MHTEALRILNVFRAPANTGEKKSWAVAYVDLGFSSGIDVLHVPVFRNRYGLFIADKRLRFRNAEQKRKVETQLQKLVLGGNLRGFQPLVISRADTGAGSEA